MPNTQQVFSVGTATSTIVAPTHDFARYVIKNLEPRATAEEAARHGNVFLVEQLFTIAAGTSVSFSLVTNSTGAQIDFYGITSDTTNVQAALIENPTVTVTGGEISAYNMNRNVSDAHTTSLKAATVVVGGTTVSQEFVTASKAAGGSMSSAKIHTLKPNTQYAMTFTNDDIAKATKVFFQLGFSERYNGYNSIWLGTPNNSFVLHGGDEFEFVLNPMETINATALVDGVNVAVLRQEA